MKTQDIFIAHPSTLEQVNALKAFMKALKIEFQISKEKDAKPKVNDNIELREDLKEAAKEVRLHKQGKIKLKTAQELLNEL